MLKWLKNLLSKDKIIIDTEDDERILSELSKGYTQFSKRVVLLCVTNLIVIEIFSMWMIYSTLDTTQISYLITSIALECLGAIIWYMKNSEAEKKARIASEIEKMKIAEENRRRKEERELLLLNSNTEFVPQEDTYEKDADRDLPKAPTVYNNYVDEVEQPQHHTG